MGMLDTHVAIFGQFDTKLRHIIDTIIYTQPPVCGRLVFVVNFFPFQTEN